MTSALAEDRPFTPSDYQLEIPGMDGYRADKLALTFSGAVDLDRTSADDLELVNGLKMFEDVKFLVTATVVKKGFAGTKGSDDREDQVGYGVGLKVHSLERV